MLGSVRGLVDDRGETLLELLIAIAIMGVVMVAVIGGLATVVRVSDIHRKQATAGAYVHDYAEAIENLVAGGGATTTGGYVNCATTTTYVLPSSQFPVPVGYNRPSVDSVRYWTGSGWSSTCPSPDTGLQQLTVAVSTVDGRVDENLVIVVRKPCGTGVNPCT
ncbi:MAG TPA: type II secretion system protein [Pseudonocardiaceae bacterium]|nr:type II secretion system protein [Pseudonocardiaceae bacterium]